MKLSHLIFPDKKKIAQLNIQLAEKDVTIACLELDLSQMKEKSFNEAKSCESGNQIYLTALKAKILELEEQIENYKICAKELQQDLDENKTEIAGLHQNIHSMQLLIKRKADEITNLENKAKECVNHQLPT